MDSIDVEPLSSVPLVALVPYKIFEDDSHIAVALETKETSPIESKNIEIPNLVDDHTRTTEEIVTPDTENKHTLLDQTKILPSRNRVARD